MSLVRPYTIIERETAENPGRLDAAWSNPATFAFATDRSGAMAEWIDRKMSGLPAEFHTGHFVLLTSGSTGQPKLVVGRRDRAENLADTLHTLQESEPVRSTVLALPLTYCYAFVNQWLWARRQGRQLVVTPGLAQPEKFRQTLDESSRAMLCLVGGQVPLLLRYFGSSTFPGVIRLHFAGGRFPQEHLGALRKVFPEAVIFNNYGCAEAMPRLALRRAEAAEQAQNVGWTLPGVEMTTDADGRLLFRSPFGAVALGDDAGFSNVDATTWVPTGDLGAQAADGHWEIHGRHGDVFKRYGEKISVAAVLSTVRANWGGQAEAYREQDRSGEAGYVIVVAPRPAEDETQAVLRELGLKHPRAHWPLRLESLAALPLLPNGKIDRGSLASQTKAETHWRQRI